MTFDLSSLGWDDHYASRFVKHDRPDQRPGRVTRVDRGVCTVITADGSQRASVGGGLLAAAARDPLRLPCTGDWVVLRSWPDECTTIDAVLPRRTAIIRAGAGAEAVAQVLATNLDFAAVIASVDPEPDLGRIERLLAIAWESGAQPVVVLTKVDLAADPDTIVAEVAQVAPGVEVHAVSAITGSGLTGLRGYVGRGQTLALLGASGSGKSTLVNALAGAPVMQTQAIRRTDGRGRHTTTFRALIPLPGGGCVVDTPGIRAVGLFDGVAGLERTFADIEALARSCRFPDCRHEREPGCAVQAALAAGEVTPRRVQSWHRLHREVAHAMRRHDTRLSEEERRRWRRALARARDKH